MATGILCVLGGTGFVGRHLVNRLTAVGWRVVVPTRHRERHRELLVNPRVTLIECDVHDPAVLRARFEGCAAVINLVGILNEPGRDSRSFQRAHVELPRKVVEAARETGVRRLLHMSALNADAREPRSRYLRSKGEGEDAVHAAAGLAVTSFRPSVIFGPDDSFFNRFATLLAISPPLFPLACPGARFAPVHVGDVAEAYATALDDPATHGRRYDLCGPETYTLREIVEYTARLTGRRRCVLPLGDALSRLQARLLEWIPGKPFSLDNYYSLQRDAVCRENGLAQLGITPAAVGSIVPGYLGGENARARYDEYRQSARRGR